MSKEEMYVADCEKTTETVKESTAYNFTESIDAKHEACKKLAKILNVPLYIV